MNKMGKGLEVFLENDYWKKYYENAPTERLKAYIELQFEMGYVADTTENEEDLDPYCDKMDELLDEMTVDELKYIYQDAGGMKRIKLRKYMAKKGYILK